MPAAAAQTIATDAMQRPAANTAITVNGFVRIANEWRTLDVLLDQDQFV